MCYHGHLFGLDTCVSSVWTPLDTSVSVRARFGGSVRACSACVGAGTLCGLCAVCAISFLFTSHNRENDLVPSTKNIYIFIYTSPAHGLNDCINCRYKMVTLSAKRSRKKSSFYQSGHKNEGWTPVFPSPGHMYCTGVSVWTDGTHLVSELVHHHSRWF